MNWEFLTRPVVEAMHDEQIRQHGGMHGIRDENAFETALARAPNKATYDEPTVQELAAAYMFGIARNHAFADGNKRTATVAAGAFLLLNGYKLTADDGTMYEFVKSVAAGEIDEDGITRFFRDRTAPVE